ncbi:MAG: hypothetical protein IKN68_04685 [Spirochaetia bacterium]|nr:hypothetical protein [Spirochaetia bacterium]
MTRNLGSAQTRPRRKQGKERCPFPEGRIIREPYVKGLSRHILTGYAGSGIPRIP